MVLRAQGGKSFVAVALVQNQGIYTVILVGTGKVSNIPNWSTSPPRADGSASFLCPVARSADIRPISPGKGRS